MKKLLLLPTLLLTINLCAATKQTTEVAQTTKKKAIAFLARHADKLKKIAYATDIALPVTLVSGVISYQIYQNAENGSNIETITEKMTDFMRYTMVATVICKIFTDPVAKYAMNKKHIFDLEALKKELTDQQEKVETA